MYRRWSYYERRNETAEKVISFLIYALGLTIATIIYLVITRPASQGAL